jgi:succinate dehydrogenase / fumarate reductase cytochrome b subunit
MKCPLLAAGVEALAAAHAFVALPIGVLLLFLWSIAFFCHLCNGIRHLAWDAGWGFELQTAHATGYAARWTAVLMAVAWL